MCTNGFSYKATQSLFNKFCQYICEISRIKGKKKWRKEKGEQNKLIDKQEIETSRQKRQLKKFYAVRKTSWLKSHFTKREIEIESFSHSLTAKEELGHYIYEYEPLCSW